MKNKKQHWVTKSYLEAWVDPSTPQNQTKYVWVFERDTGKPKKKAPKNIFCETDFYTSYNNNGDRDLTLETNLSSLEAQFASIRKLKLESHKPLTSEESIILTIFVSAMLHRTKLRRNKEKALWGHVLKIMDDMAQHTKAKPLHPIKRLSDKNNENALSHDQVRALAKQPMPNMLSQATAVTTEILMKMSAHIIHTSTTPGFITSDHPCVIFDTNPEIQLPGLGSKSIEITFPISPGLMLIFFWSEPKERFRYVDAEAVYPAIVDEMNHRTRFYCEEYFISAQSELIGLDWDI